MLKLAVFVSLLIAQQAFCWQWSLTNWAASDVWVLGEYAWCNNDIHPRRVDKLGGVQHMNADECLMTAITAVEAGTGVAAVP